MLINGAPLNSGPLNGLASGATAGPVAIRPPSLPAPGQRAVGFAYRWSLSVTLDGVQIAQWLTGSISIDREEGAAGVATFSLFYPQGAPVPVDMARGEIVIDLLTETGGETTVDRRYRGLVVEPVWDAVTRVMAVTCGDNLQQRVEALPIASIDALCGGWWTPDLFEETDGRPRWDYANERLESRTASLDMSTNGDLRVTGWFAGAAAFVFEPGSTIYQSVNTELAGVGNATNRVELEIGYRYSRLWQRNESYQWLHPGAEGFSGMQAFCAWRNESTELPNVEMIVSATESAGLSLLSAQYTRTPLTAADPCGNGQPWLNTEPDLLLGATWTCGRRWTQYITERYSIVMATEAGQVEAKQIIGRESTSLEIESERAEEWESAEFSSGSAGIEDLTDVARRDAVFICSMRRAYKTIIGAHRATTVRWQVPTPMAYGIDLPLTVELNDGTRARGKVRRIVDDFDLDSGVILTTISLAVMRGGGESDPIMPPARPLVDMPEGAAGGGLERLATQIGGWPISPEYDDELDGFSGNYSVVNGNYESFPRSFSITASEIQEELRDERTVPVAALFRVGIPNDLLEL